MFSSIEEKYGYLEFFKETLKSFGGVIDKDKKNYVFRNKTQNLSENGCYFGCISEDEADSQAYSDLSVVVFPSDEKKNTDDRWIVAFALGSLGYNNDSYLGTEPGTRRLFLDSLEGKSYIKKSFADTKSTSGFSSFCKKYKEDISNSLKRAYKNYTHLIFACTIIDPNLKDEARKVIKNYLSIYASLREFPGNADQRKAVKEARNRIEKDINEEEEIKNLVEDRYYIVLQGAPGTGKTRMAKKVALSKAKSDNIFFIQFHAETAFSDFVYGIVPAVKEDTLKYKETEGIFLEAVRRAIDLKESKEKVFLIIDEINRANLSNVLGQAFYLFEPPKEEIETNSETKTESKPVEVKLSPDYSENPLSIDRLPDNLYVIATMNTADRSLAVVDFALRRRFAWYSMHPHNIKFANNSKWKFCDDEFNSIAEIFYRYATDEELNLQPGHSYFIVPKDEKEAAMKNRMKYEIMPLIKEYLLDGMLSRAYDEFSNYFREYLGEELFR